MNVTLATWLALLEIQCSREPLELLQRGYRAMQGIYLVILAVFSVYKPLEAREEEPSLPNRP